MLLFYPFIIINNGRSFRIKYPGRSSCRHKEDVLREFLIRRREEVTKVTLLDYTFDRCIELEREDAREEALAEERANTERERKAKEEEQQRAEQAEKEVQRLRAELEQYKRRFSESI